MRTNHVLRTIVLELAMLCACAGVGRAGDYTIAGNLVVESNIVAEGDVAFADQGSLRVLMNQDTQLVWIASGRTNLVCGANVVYASAYGDRNSATLNQVINRVGTNNPVVLVIDGGTWNITATVEFPANISLRFMPDSELSGSASVRIHGCLFAGLYQIFDGVYVSGFERVEHLYPQWWGARGDDDIDDTEALQAMVVAAKTKKLVSIVFPMGQYFLEPQTNLTSILSFNCYDATPGRKLSVVGDDARIYTYASYGGLNQDMVFMSFSHGYEKVSVDGLTFEVMDPISSTDTNGTHSYNTDPLGSTMAATEYKTTALNFGFKKSVQSRAIVRNCEFINFSRDIMIRGCSYALIENNRFLALHGRDSCSDSSSSAPCVAIWAFMNDAGLSDISEGITENIHVVGNYFNGYANIPDCGDIFLKGKDGLVYGRCAGWQISDNIIKNFGYEGIFVSPISNAVDQLSLEEREHYTWMPNVIAGNLVGHQMYGGGYNGIRCNAENVLVANNNIQLNSHVREDSTIGNAHGITISQNGQGHIRDATIIDNNITLPYGGFGISVSCCTNGLIIKDNVIKFGTLLEQNGSGLSQYAIRCGYCWGAALVENNCIMLDDSLTNIVANTEAATVSDLHSVGILDHYSKVHYRGNFIKGFPYAFGNHQALGSVVDRSNRRVDCYKPYCYINNSQVFYEETNLRATHSEPDIMQTSVPILEENSSCPSLYIGFVNKTANTSTTTITNFNDGVVACTYTLIISDSYTTFDFSNTSLKGNGGADWSPDVGDHMTCVYDGTNWYCSISDNTP